MLKNKKHGHKRSGTVSWVLATQGKKKERVPCLPGEQGGHHSNGVQRSFKFREICLLGLISPRIPGHAYRSSGPAKVDLSRFNSDLYKRIISSSSEAAQLAFRKRGLELSRIKSCQKRFGQAQLNFPQKDNPIQMSRVTLMFSKILGLSRLKKNLKKMERSRPKSNIQNKDADGDHFSVVKIDNIRFEGWSVPSQFPFQITFDLMKSTERRAERNPNAKGKRSFVPKI